MGRNLPLRTQDIIEVRRGIKVPLYSKYVLVAYEFAVIFKIRINNPGLHEFQTPENFATPNQSNILGLLLLGKMKFKSP